MKEISGFTNQIGVEWGEGLGEGGVCRNKTDSQNINRLMLNQLCYRENKMLPQGTECCILSAADSDRVSGGPTCQRFLLRWSILGGADNRRVICTDL